MDYKEYYIDGYTVYEVPYALPQEEIVLADLYKMLKYFRKDAKTMDDVFEEFKKRKKKAKKSSFGPGIQLDLGYASTPELSSVQAILSRKVLEFNNSVHERKGEEVYGNAWTFVSTPENTDSNYHTHNQFCPKEPSIVNTWTWTYYLELPNKVEGDEGKLFFSMNENDEKALKIFPKKQHLYIFNAEIPHRPEINPNSSNNRTVLAGNVSIPTYNVKKTLI